MHDKANCSDVVFHSQRAAAAQGLVFENNGYNWLVVEISRDTGTSTVKFWGSQTTKVLDSMRALAGKPIHDTTQALAVSTTGTGELWFFDVRGVRYINFEVDAVSGGAKVDVKGRFTT
jgi:hypothetical protein